MILISEYTLRNANEPYQRVEDVNYLNYYLNKINRQDAEILVMLHILGMTFVDVSRALRVSSERIRQRNARGLRKFKWFTQYRLNLR